MSEYLLTVLVPAGESRTFPVPGKGIAGVYSTSAISIKWDFNGTTAELKSSATDWEPLGGFRPALTSALVLDNTAGGSAATVAVRCYDE